MDSTVRVLHVLPSLDPAWGGPVSAVRELIALGDLSGSEMTVAGEILSVADETIRAKYAHEPGIHLFPGRTRYLYSSELRRWITAEVHRFDLVMLHGMWLYPLLAASRECQAQGIPYVSFPHGNLEPWSWYRQGLWKAIKKTVYWVLCERQTIARATAVFFTSLREKSLALGMVPVKRLGNDTFIVCPYGIIPESRQTSGPARAELAIPEGFKCALFLGRVHPKKNVDFLINAWKAARIPANWLLVIAGPEEPGYMAKLQKMIQDTSSIRFVGPVYGDDKNYLYQRASWFMLPSKQENFGIVVLEALSNGCPVAISDQVYIGDRFHQSSQILPLEPAAWVDFLQRVMPNEAERQALCDLDRRLIMPQFRREVVAAGWIEAVTEVVDKASRATACRQHVA